MLTREQARQIDRTAIQEMKIPGIVLMENAGRGCAEILLREITDLNTKDPQPGKMKNTPFSPKGQTPLQTEPRGNLKKGADPLQASDLSRYLVSPERASPLFQITSKHGVVICCGPGNNGGDGFVIARHLHLAGVPVKIIVLANPQQYRGDAAVNWQIVQRMPIETVFSSQDNILSQKDFDIASQLSTVTEVLTTWIVDAILGTGSSGPLRQSLVPWVQAINQASARRLAVDLPTGMDCDTGVVDPVAIVADITCTFVDWKQGFTHPDADRYLGRVEIVNIGCP